MAVRENTVVDANILTSIGGTVAAGDTVLLDRENVEAYTAGLSSLAGFALAAFYARMPCASSIGADGTPLQLDAGVVMVEGGHRYAYLAGVALKTITKMKLAGVNRPQNFVSSADITRLLAGTGVHDIADSADVTDADAYRGAVLTLRNGGAKATNVRAHPGGRVVLERDTTNAEANGDGRIILNHTDASPDTLVLRGGGTVEPVLGYAAVLTSYGGTVDMRRAGPDPSWTTINIEGPTNVILPAAGSIEDWTGGATVNGNAGVTVTLAPPTSGVF